MSEETIPVPIMPTGSGIADLEIAREQDALLNGDVEQVVPPEQAPMDDAAGGPQVSAAAESEAHPS